MINRALTVAFCPSGSCIGTSADTDRDATADAKGESHTRDLLRAVDFYATVLAMASHDLRQPLQVIVSAHELLARRLTARPEREHLERSEQASNQLEEKFDQLVEALQLQQRASRIQPVPVQLDPILERVALQFNGSAQRKGIDFRTLRTRAVIMSQPVLLDGILRNLARNAVDHTPPAAVSSSAADVTQRLFASRFTTQATAFRRMSYKEFSSPFFRLDATSSEGLGLGLFIVKRAADCLGHRVELRSVLGRGSCFSVVAQDARPDQGPTGQQTSLRLSR
jgi:two-component system phosphate regulon sensor histidine kinase PhoR